MKISEAVISLRGDIPRLPAELSTCPEAAVGKGGFMSDKVKHITDSSFEQEVLKSAGPVLVDFWASWCGPCLMMAPVIDELAETYDGKVAFAKVNVDDNPKTAATYGIMAIPTLILFKDGKPLDKMVGVVAKAKLAELISKNS